MVLITVGLVAAVAAVAAAAGAAGGIITVIAAALMSNSSADSVGCLAKPFTGKTEDELNEYITSRWESFRKFPNYEKQIHWDVYLLYKKVLGHYSLLFVTRGHIEGFLIHLVVNEEKKTEFRLKAVNLCSYSDDHPDFKALSLGITEAFEAKHIITKAHERLVNMGCYNTLFNNCQHYCHGVASDLQVSIIHGKWSEELNTILQGIASVTTTGAVAVGTVVESVKCLQHVGPPAGSSLIKPIKSLYKYYDATTNETKKDV